MAKQATHPTGPNKGRTRRAPHGLIASKIRGTSGQRDRLRTGLLERVLVMRAACADVGITFDDWYSGGAEMFSGALVLDSRKRIVIEAWRQLRMFAEAADLTVAELLWSVGLDFNDGDEPGNWGANDARTFEGKR